MKKRACGSEIMPQSEEYEPMRSTGTKTSGIVIRHPEEASWGGRGARGMGFGLANVGAVAGVGSGERTSSQR